jgi:hypothetical protein
MNASDEEAEAIKQWGAWFWTDSHKLNEGYFDGPFVTYDEALSFLRKYHPKYKTSGL